MIKKPFPCKEEWNEPCPGCGCPIWCHNAVNGIGNDMRIAHCGGCGGCWKTKDHPEYVEKVCRFLTENKS
jgi:hypothetical protein